MATDVSISTKELQRVASLAYEGQVASIMLCLRDDSSLTEESLVSEWESVELEGGGYVRQETTIGTGSYSQTNSRYELPTIDTQFTATGNLVYDAVVIFIGENDHPYAVLIETPNIVLVAGQTQTYRLSLNCDD
jgi:hypothetical protein